MKAFIIVMQESEHSVTLANDCIAAAQQYGIVPEVWPAVNGYHAADKFKEYGITKFLHPKMISSPGVQGCFLSHYELWNKCVELNETILILEHDGVMIRPLPDNIELMFTDVLNLDPYDQALNEYNSMVKSSIMFPVAYQYKFGKKVSHSGKYVKGAYGYIIKPVGAKKLINFSNDYGILPTDKHIGSNVVDLKSTVVPIVRLHEFFSTHSIPKYSSTKNLGDHIS